MSKESQELRSLIISPIISDSKKEQLFEAIFKNKISDLTFDFLILLIRKNRINIINDIYISFNKLYYKEKGLLAVTVTTAQKSSALLDGDSSSTSNESSTLSSAWLCFT